jgi:hypothetical protein
VGLQSLREPSRTVVIEGQVILTRSTDDPSRLPGSITGSPGGGAGLPGAIAGVPGAIAGVPEAATGVPRAGAGVPGVTTEGPGTIAGVPGIIQGTSGGIPWTSRNRSGNQATTAVRLESPSPLWGSGSLIPLPFPQAPAWGYTPARLRRSSQDLLSPFFMLPARACILQAAVALCRHGYSDHHSRCTGCGEGRARCSGCSSG